MILLTCFTIACVINENPISQVAYINNYHTQCRDKVAPLLQEMNKPEGLNWLLRETEPIG